MAQVNKYLHNRDVEYQFTTPASGKTCCTHDAQPNLIALSAVASHVEGRDKGDYWICAVRQDSKKEACRAKFNNVDSAIAKNKNQSEMKAGHVYRRSGAGAPPHRWQLQLAGNSLAAPPRLFL